ncbi:hypothetical protein BD770DRAFT_186432 [Pilaira anomala]|nr:hypothetical protein BD770DRAFT_186432 [Pilaira anomala]
MNQNDFNHSSAPTTTAAAAAAGLGAGAIATSGTTKIASNEPLSPFDHSRRFAPTQPGYGEPAAYPDYHENYSQAGYSQGGYSQEGAYNQDYPQQQQQQQPYGYYDNGYPQDPYQSTANAGYDQYHQQPGYYEQPNAVYANPTSPTSAGNLSDKPNVKDYSSKPNEL